LRRRIISGIIDGHAARPRCLRRPCLPGRLRWRAIAGFRSRIRSRKRATYARHHGSWVNPQAKSALALVYVSSSFPNDRVFIYTYPGGQLDGQVTGLLQPAGECVDAKGNIYIANSGASSVVRVARGDAHSDKTFDTNGSPIGCAVSPNGDLAVANFDTPGVQPGNIQVFKGASGKPIQYNNRECDELFPPATTTTVTFLWNALTP
jgi:hypothetical protein